MCKLMPPKQPFLLKTLIVILLMLISTISNAVITAPAKNGKNGKMGSETEVSPQKSNQKQ